MVGRKKNYREGYRGKIIEMILENGFIPTAALRLFDPPTSTMYQRSARRMKEEGCLQELKTISGNKYLRLTDEGARLIKETLPEDDKELYHDPKVKAALRYLGMTDVDKERKIAYKMQQDKFYNDVAAKLFSQIAGIETESVPELNEREIDSDSAAYYDSAKVKRLGSFRADLSESKKLMNSRINGLVISPGGVYSVYNTGKTVPEWKKDGETKMASSIQALIGRSMREYSATSYDKEAVIISKKDSNFVRIMQGEGRKGKFRRTLMNIDTAYERMYAIPYTHDGVKLFKIMQQDGWQGNVKTQILSAEEIEESNYVSVACDGYDRREGIYKLVFCIPNMSKLKAFSKRAGIEENRDKYHVYCYKSQLPIVAPMIGDNAKVFAIDIDDMCMELDIE